MKSSNTKIEDGIRLWLTKEVTADLNHLNKSTVSIQRYQVKAEAVPPLLHKTRRVECSDV